MRISIWLTYIILLLMPLPCNAISKYINEKGITVFVDDESKIPIRYLDSIQTVEGLNEMSAEDKDAQAERLRKAREQRRSELTQKRMESAEQERLKLYQTPIIVSGAQILVPVEVAFGNRTAKLNLLLDTGASRTLFHENSLARLDIGAEEGDISFGVGVGGYRIETRVIKFRSITVGPFKADGASAFVITHRNARVSYDGLLGMDFLRYLSYDIDYENQTIQWDP